MASLDDALGDPIAAINAGEHIDQNGLDAAVGQDQAKRRGNALRRGAAAEIEKIGGAAARIFDRVHGCHGEPGTIDNAADIAVEANIVEVMLGGLDLARVLLRMVAHVGDATAPEQRIVVERHLGIESEDPVVLGHDERIDLDHGGVEIAECAVAAKDAGDGAADLLEREAKTEGEFARLEGLEPHRRLDHHLQDFLWMVLGDLLDFHAAEAGCDDPHPLDLPVENEAEVNLALERFGDLDIDPLHDFALGARLIGDEGFAKHLCRRRAHFVIGLAKLDAARLATAARMDLRLHRPMPAAEFCRAIDRLLGAVGDRSMRRRHAKIRQDLLSLVLVNVQMALLTFSGGIKRRALS
ncbi:MAG: hypothetical protein USCAAHI_02684 [Beijerinckiaceae bacterium]|nr:MAG: hypothetical protein USCAAHI_02684 [Beijerinckiaceae bacterium]